MVATSTSTTHLRVHAELRDRVDHLDLDDLEVRVCQVADLVDLTLKSRILRQGILVFGHPLLDLKICKKMNRKAVLSDVDSSESRLSFSKDGLLSHNDCDSGGNHC